MERETNTFLCFLCNPPPPSSLLPPPSSLLPLKFIQKLQQTTTTTHISSLLHIYIFRLHIIILIFTTSIKMAE